MVSAGRPTITVPVRTNDADVTQTIFTGTTSGGIRIAGILEVGQDPPDGTPPGTVFLIDPN